MVHRESKIPSAAEALPGRTKRSRFPPATLCSARPWLAPSQANSRSSSAWAASGARKSSSGRSPACSRRLWATQADTTPNPTYREVCSGQTGHTEAVLVVYDPRVVSLEALLKVFWEAHDPTQGMRQGNDTGTQYRSAVYASSADDLRQVEESRAAFQQALKAAGFGAITTETRLAPPFYYAEDTTSSTSPRIPTAIADSAAPAFRATRNSGCGVRNDSKFERFEVRRNKAS